MAKIQINSISVFNLQYKGENTQALEKGYRYVAVVIEGFTDEGSMVILEFQNGDNVQIKYDSFITFNYDWIILSEFKFDKPYLPVKSGN